MTARSIFFALLFAASAAPAAAQDRDTSAVPGFDGGVHFGATVEQVNTFWREQPNAQRTERGVTLLEYDPWQQMNWTVMVDDQRGMIGFHAVSLPFGNPRQCEQMLDNLVRAATESFPGVTRSGARRDAQGEPLCPAVAAGRAQARYDWVNPRNGVGARLWVDPADGLIHYALGTRYFRQWAGLEQAATAQAAPAQPAQPSQPAQGSSSAAPQAPANARNLGVTADAFRAIRPGMSLQQVTEVIGRAGTRAQQQPTPGVNSETHTWQEAGTFRNIGVTFLDGRAILSMEVGLYPMDAGTPITLAQYQQLREGMTYEQVVQLFGGPGVYTGFVDVLGRVTHGYRWRGRAPGSLATASFLDGRATSVHLQAGLQ